MHVFCVVDMAIVLCPLSHLIFEATYELKFSIIILKMRKLLLRVTAQKRRSNKVA